MKRLLVLVLWLSFFLSIARPAVAANAWLTDKQFQDQGVYEVIGRVIDAQVTYSDKYSEAGSIKLQISRVVYGSISLSTLTLPFQRVFAPADDAGNWDLLAPSNQSLAHALPGKSLLLFLQNGSALTLYPANNAVQDISNGLLLGKVVSVRKTHGDPYWEGGLEVEIQVVESVYGWVSGTTVVLPLASPLLLTDHRFQGGLSNGLMFHIFPSVLNVFNEGSCIPMHNSEFFVSFAGGEIQSIQVASKQELAVLQVADSQ